MSSELGLKNFQRQSKYIYYAVEESIYWLENAGRSLSMRPVGYSIRIAWEMLYRAREELSQFLCSSHATTIYLGRMEQTEAAGSLNLLDSFSTSIDQTMKEILSIEIEPNLSSAQQSAKRCSEELTACLFRIGDIRSFEPLALSATM